MFLSLDEVAFFSLVEVLTALFTVYNAKCLSKEIREISEKSFLITNKIYMYSMQE